MNAARARKRLVYGNNKRDIAGKRSAGVVRFISILIFLISIIHVQQEIVLRRLLPCNQYRRH